jgi:hypothetical protein
LSVYFLFLMVLFQQRINMRKNVRPWSRMTSRGGG